MQVVDDVDAFPVGVIGPLVETHARFPRRVNAGFMQVVDRNNIRLRVHERGAGETLACGTAPARRWPPASAAACSIRRCASRRGGVLTVAWDGAQLRMTGPAESVFSGQIDIDKLVFSMALNR